MPRVNNEVDLTTVGDVVLHIYYTALDGGGGFEQAVQAYNAANLPTAGIKVFSAQNDFSAPAASAANPYPVTPWSAFLATVTAPANQTLTLSISPAKFPAWAQGKTISVTSITLVSSLATRIDFCGCSASAVANCAGAHDCGGGCDLTQCLCRNDQSSRQHNAGNMELRTAEAGRRGLPLSGQERH